MTLLAFSSVGVRFGAEPLLADVSFTVRQGERWGIVGRNGTGKTTLLHLIRGTLEPEAGALTRHSGLTVTMLDQYREFGYATTVWEAAAQGYEHLLDLERSLARKADRLGDLGSDVTGSELEAFDKAQERFQHMGGYSFRARVDAVLQGLGFDADAARARPLSQLSGGERGRVGLAAQLAAPADLILLDEPTNHLDLDTIDWLKSHLTESGKTVMVISHDRAFLDDFADHVLHVSQGTATPYRGGYSSFVEQRANALLARQREADEQRREVLRQEEFIRRNIAGQKTAQAKSRRRRLSRLPRLSPPPSDEEAMGLRFELSNRGGDQVLVVEGLEVRAGPKLLVQGFSAIARRGDVISVVGPNGAGKSTLLATLLGEKSPSSGTVRMGAGINAAWYRQDHSHLPAGAAVYDCVSQARPEWNRGQIQDHLGRFGFSGDEVRRSTDSLSGGERARTALALITLQGSNLLALDEPTNHLDVESIEALEDALEDYPGTVLLVSHDRALLRELATRVWAFQDGKLVDYPGPFVDWEEKVAEEESTRLKARLEAERAARLEEKERIRKVTLAKKASDAPIREARRVLARIEGQVAELEEEISEIEQSLARPALYDGSPENAGEVHRLNAQLKSLRTRLDEALGHWAQALEELESLERQ
jgi:ATP-binding cassette subfamily F protein 3